MAVEDSSSKLVYPLPKGQRGFVWYSCTHLCVIWKGPFDRVGFGPVSASRGLRLVLLPTSTGYLEQRRKRNLDFMCARPFCGGKKFFKIVFRGFNSQGYRDRSAGRHLKLSSSLPRLLLVAELGEAEPGPGD